jgi:hypothetical protein
MKLFKTASGKEQIKISKRDWLSIGKFAGWIKRSDDEEELQDDIQVEEAPVKAPSMGWDPSGIREELQEKHERTAEEMWADVNVSFEIKDTKYGKLTLVVLSNTSPELKDELKAMKYKPFQNRITKDWTWSKFANKYKSEELDLEKVEAIKQELSAKGVDVSVLNNPPVEVLNQVDTGEGSKQEQEQAEEVPEELVLWHNEMKAAQELSPKERKSRYSDIIRSALEQVGEETESDAASEKSQEIVKSLLEAASKFHNYSFWNSMMIAFTRPMAQYVASKDAWKIMGRVIKKGAKPIPIMFPMRGRELSEEDKQDMTDQQIAWASRTRFGMGSAFAYEDTEPISEDWVSKKGRWKGKGPFEPPEWMIDSNEATEWMNQLYSATYKWATEEKKFKIDIEGTGSAGGYATLGGKIAISDKSEGIRKLSTLFHEIAHQLIHFDPDFSRKDSTKQDRETDAEATAYVVCSHYHIETKDTPIYLAGFGANKEKILGRFNYIKKAAVEIFEGIDKVMSAMELVKGLKTDQEKEMEPNEVPTPDRVPEESLSMAGNFFGSLGLFKKADAMPFLYIQE